MRNSAEQDGVWRHGVVPPLAPERTVAVLGLGELGRAVVVALVGLGFDVVGWSRREKELPGLRTFSGEDGLSEALAAAEIVVTLLPATPDTERLLDARRLAELPPGARLINPGRGGLIDDDALIAALDAGTWRTPPSMSSARSRCRRSTRSGRTRWSR